MARGEYNTKQRQEILAYLQAEKNSHKTAKDVQKYFLKENIEVGLTTIYRHLNKLIKEGIVKKYKLNSHSGAYFEYVVKDGENLFPYHCHCNNCGKIIHIECDEITAFKEHIKNCHGFYVDSFETTFYGLCSNCNNAIESRIK